MNNAAPGNSRKLQTSHRFDGWKILSLLWFLFMNFSFILYGGSVLNAYMARSLNMPRERFGLGVSLAYLLMGFGSPIVALLIRKWGARLTLCTGMLLLSAAALVLGVAVNGVPGFIVAYGLMGGMGLAIGGILPLQNVVSNWFLRRRSLATAVLFTSGGVGGLLASFLFSALIENAGFSWKQVWLLLAGFSLLLAVLTFLFVRDHPRTIGQHPDGINLDVPIPSQQEELEKPNRVFQTQEEWSFREAIRTPAAWLLIVGSLGMAVSFEFCSAYGVIHLMDIGFPNVLASFSVGALAFFAIVGRVITGALGDRMELRWLMTAGSALIALGCLALIASSSAILIVLYALLTGLGQGLVFVSLLAVMPNYFGPKATTTVMGVGMMVTAGATAAAIYLGGAIRSASGSYVTGFLICAVIAGAAMVSSFLAKPPHKPRAAHH